MRAILSGIAVALVLAVLAGFVLAEVQKPSFEAYLTPSVRLGDPGHNLVGQNWTGGQQPKQPL